MTETNVRPRTDITEELTLSHEQSQAAMKNAIRLLEADDEPVNLVDLVCQSLSESLLAKGRWSKAWYEIEDRRNAYHNSL
jgi:hypothetical protein